MGLLRECLSYMRTTKRWWLLPFLIILSVLALAALVLEGVSFLYPIM